MSKLQSIENALSEINSAAFQELCDSILFLKNENYKTFSRNGSQNGKQNTIKGTPDSFLILPNNKYIFVEYSTNKTEGFKKLKKDIEKCLNTEKTGIALTSIEEIIICINFRIKPNEIEILKQIVNKKNIEFKLFTIDDLSLELNLNYPNLAYTYLGLPFDSGQIVSIETFINEYNKASGGIATPLDNTFLHRSNEICELKEKLISNDIVILTGAPGIGKTKLALEGINIFLKENSTYKALCVSYKSFDLLENLILYFPKDKDFILFVDDANRIDKFNQIIGFYKGSRNAKLKILITVRNYAVNDILNLCQQYEPQKINLEKFTYEQIIDIIKAEPFNILKTNFHNAIFKIADGNSRLAIMASLLANINKNIFDLQDVSQLYEKYFSTFINDNSEFNKEINLKCLGLIAFFYTISFNNMEITNSILIKFNIEYAEFIDVINRLENLELVEIQYDIVKISEQNLSTYFFYKVFIKDNLLSFETLLNTYFESSFYLFKDCVMSAQNLFGEYNLNLKLNPYLKNYWNEIKNNENLAFKFLSIFWFYLKDETMEFLYKYITALPTPIDIKYNIDYKNNDLLFNNNIIIELLKGFLINEIKFKNALDLGFEYTKRIPAYLSEFIIKIRETLIFNEEDLSHSECKRQTILFQILIDGLNNRDSFFVKVFYELATFFLSIKFIQFSGSGNSLVRQILQINPTIQKFRENIWNNVEKNYKKYPDESFCLLLNYYKTTLDLSNNYIYNLSCNIIKFDIPILINIIENNLNQNSFEHCKYVQEQIKFLKNINFSNPKFTTLTNKYTNQLYKMHLKLHWNILNDNEIQYYKNLESYDKLKEQEVRNTFIFKNEVEVEKFYNKASFLLDYEKEIFFYNRSLDYLIDENCDKKFELGLFLIKKIIENNNKGFYYPKIVFENHLNTVDKVILIWSIIKSNEFINKELWEFSFYYKIKDSLIIEEYVHALIKTISSINNPIQIIFNKLEKFLKIKPDLFQIILKIIMDKNEKEKLNFTLNYDFFSLYFEHLGNNIKIIKKGYLQQNEINYNFDNNGKELLTILMKDPTFLLDYVKNEHRKHKSELSYYKKNLNLIWQLKNIEKVLEKTFEYLNDHYVYYGFEYGHYCNSFFRNLEPDKINKAQDFIRNYCKKNFSNVKKMNVIVDIIRISMEDMFEEILLLFLSKCQDLDFFSKIMWRGNSNSGSGFEEIANIEINEWNHIRSIIEKSDVGIKLIPIKNYLNDRIVLCKYYLEDEKKRKFKEKY